MVREGRRWLRSQGRYVTRSVTGCRAMITTRLGNKMIQCANWQRTAN